MSNNKQSSVEWVIGEIIKHQMTFYGTSSMPLSIIKKAKAMHKEEIEEACNASLIENGITIAVNKGNDYYSETYEDNNE